eukprot:INCI9898.5.p1 GENE.INCI9898.5~~INCI9898.5.p1  ORF type:complete len:3392 (+),score=597.94 INCI9898.5:972-10178(+)
MDDSGRENGDNEAISAEELQEARNEEFIDFLCNQRVIDVLFEHLHQQCFIQSRELFVYLGEMRKRGHRHALPDATLRVLWKRCVAAPDYLASEMCTLLVKTFPSLPPSAVSTLLKHITAELLHQGPNVENAVVARRRTIVLLGSMHAEGWLCTPTARPRPPTFSTEANGDYGPQPALPAAVNADGPVARLRKERLAPLHSTLALIWICIRDPDLLARLRGLRPVDVSGSNSGSCVHSSIDSGGGTNSANREPSDGRDSDDRLAHLLNYFVLIIRQTEDRDVQQHYLAQCIQILQSPATTKPVSPASLSIVEGRACFSAAALYIVQGILESTYPDTSSVVQDVDESCGGLIAVAIDQLCLFASSVAEQMVPHLRSILGFVTYCATKTPLSIRSSHIRKIWDALRIYHEVPAGESSSPSWVAESIPAGRMDQVNSDSTMRSRSSPVPPSSPQPSRPERSSGPSSRDILFVFFTELTDLMYAPPSGSDRQEVDGDTVASGNTLLCDDIAEEAVLKEIFDNYLCAVKPEFLPLEGFYAFKHYLLTICNKETIVMETNFVDGTSSQGLGIQDSLGDIVQVRSRHFEGKEYLWRLILDACGEVSQLATGLMRDIFLTFGASVAHEEMQELISRFLLPTLRAALQEFSTVVASSCNESSTTSMNDSAMRRVVRVLRLATLLASDTAGKANRCHFSNARGRACGLTIVMPAPYVYSPLVFNLGELAGLHSRSTVGDVRRLVDVHLRHAFRMFATRVSSDDYHFFLHFSDKDSARAAETGSSSELADDSQILGDRGQNAEGNVGGRVAQPYDLGFLQTLSQAANVSIYGAGKLLPSNHLAFVQLGITDRAVLVMRAVDRNSPTYADDDVDSQEPKSPPERGSIHGTDEDLHAASNSELSHAIGPLPKSSTPAKPLGSRAAAVWNALAENEELAPLVIQLLDCAAALSDGVSDGADGAVVGHRTDAHTAPRNRIHAFAQHLWDFLRMTPTASSVQHLFSPETCSFNSPEDWKRAIMGSSDKGKGTLFTSVYRLQVLAGILSPVVHRNLVFNRPLARVETKTPWRESQIEQLRRLYTRFVDGGGLSVVLNFLSSPLAQDSFSPSKIDSFQLRRVGMLPPLHLLRTVLLHEPYIPAVSEPLRPSCLPSPHVSGLDFLDSAENEGAVAAVYFHGHCGTNAEYQGLFRVTEDSSGHRIRHGGGMVFRREGQVHGAHVSLMFVEAQQRWHICAEGLKQPVLFSDPVNDATIATLVATQFQFVPYSAKFKSSNEIGVSWMYARQLQCTPLRATVEAVMGARRVGTPVHRDISSPKSTPPKIIHPLTEKIRGFLKPEQFLQKVVSTVILESKFSGSDSDEDVIHNEILDSALHLVVFAIKTYPGVAEQVFLDTPTKKAFPDLLGMLLLHRSRGVRVRLAQAFTAFASISPRCFRAVLRQSLDDLVNLRDVFIQSVSFSSSAAQFFDMTTNLAHSQMGRSQMAQGASAQFVRYIPLLLNKLGVVMNNSAVSGRNLSDAVPVRQGGDASKAGSSPSSAAASIPQKVVTGVLSLVEVLVASADVDVDSSDAQTVDALLISVVEDCLFRVPDKNPPMHLVQLAVSSARTVESHESLGTAGLCNELHRTSLFSAEASQPLCRELDTREQAFTLLLEIVKNSPARLVRLAAMLKKHLELPVRLRARSGHTDPASLFFTPGGRMPFEFERSEAGFVGLTNQGLTCYMNATLQQLYFLKHLRQHVLAARLQDSPHEHAAKMVAAKAGREKSKRSANEDVVPNDNNAIEARMRAVVADKVNSVLARMPASAVPAAAASEDKHDIVRQLQRTLLFLQESRVRHYDPAPLVAACNGLGLEYGVYAQNDARDFMDRLLDQCEATFREKNQPGALSAIRWHFNGMSANENIRSCGHNSSSEQPFYLLEVVIKGCQTLHEALRNMVAGEHMVGDNQLSCDSCDSKVDAVRRFCIKTLPNTLVLQLKRFDLDFTVFQLYKLNSRLEFPFQEYLDMHPYTHEGLREQDNAADAGQSTKPGSEKPVNDGDGSSQDNDENDDDVDSNDGENSESAQDKNHSLYQLRGVVIHQGEAGGGHYYSLIRSDDGQWSKFDDEDVQVFDVRDFGYQCFGGVEQVMVDIKGHKVTRTRDICHNAYMLFYERVHPQTPEDPSDEDASDSEDDETSSSAQAPASGPGSGSSSNGDMESAQNKATDTTQTEQKPDTVMQNVAISGYERYARDVWDDNREASRCLLLLDPALNSFLFALLHQFNDVASLQSCSQVLQTGVQKLHITSAAGDRTGFDILVCFFMHALCFMVDIAHRPLPSILQLALQPWRPLVCKFLRTFPKIGRTFRHHFVEGRLQQADNASQGVWTQVNGMSAPDMVEWLLKRTLLHPNDGARHLFKTTLEHLLLDEPEATLQQYEAVRHLAYDGAPHHDRDVVVKKAVSVPKSMASPLVAECLCARVVQFLPLLQVRVEKRGRHFVSLVGAALGKHLAHFAGQGETPPSVDLGAVWLHFLCGGESPLQAVEADSTKKKAPQVDDSDDESSDDNGSSSSSSGSSSEIGLESSDEDEISSLRDAPLDNEVVTDESELPGAGSDKNGSSNPSPHSPLPHAEGTKQHQPQEAAALEEDDDDEADEDYVDNGDGDSDESEHGHSIGSEGEVDREHAHMCTLAKTGNGFPVKGCRAASLGLGAAVETVPLLRKWISSKVGILRGAAVRQIFQQLGLILRYRRENLVNESVVEGPGTGIKQSTSSDDNTVTPSPQRALTASVVTCLASSRSLWLEWIRHFQEPALFATHVARACANDGRLSTNLIEWLVANLDEKGYQTRYCVEAFQRPAVLLHGEDALVNILRLQDSQALVDLRLNAIFLAENDRVPLLERIRLWQTNDTSKDGADRTNALEVLRMMRLVLRLYREVPAFCQRVTAGPAMWSLASIVFYLQRANAKFGGQKEWQQAVAASDNTLRKHFAELAQSPSDPVNCSLSAARTAPIWMRSVVQGLSDLVESLQVTEANLEAWHAAQEAERKAQRYAQQEATAAAAAAAATAERRRLLVSNDDDDDDDGNDCDTTGEFTGRDSVTDTDLSTETQDDQSPRDVPH